jgi:hypothetical protein
MRFRVKAEFEVTTDDLERRLQAEGLEAEKGDLAEYIEETTLELFPLIRTWMETKDAGVAERDFGLTVLASSTAGEPEPRPEKIDGRWIEMRKEVKTVTRTIVAEARDGSQVLVWIGMGRPQVALRAEDEPTWGPPLTIVSDETQQVQQ